MNALRRLDRPNQEQATTIELHGRITRIEIPAAFGKHPLVHEKTFYTIPKPLWDHVFANIPKCRFDPDLLAMELALAEIGGDHTSSIGISRNIPIIFNMLRRSHLDLETLREVTKSADPASLLATLNQRLDRIAQNVRGYLGWLMMNPDFLQEHDELFEQFGDSFTAGIPQPGPTIPAGAKLPPGFRAVQPDNRTAAAAAAVREFCRKWRLQRIAGPFLPEPLSPQFPAMHLSQSEGYVTHGGVNISMPDTYPIPGRAEIVSLLEDTLRGAGVPPHLSAWVAIANSGNRAKGEIPRFGRLFEIQHYCRILYTRHPAALRRAAIHLEQALADFLDVDAAVIHKDLGWIKRRLGENWMSRSNSLIGHIASMAS